MVPLIDLGDRELVRKKYMSIGQQHRIADFTLAGISERPLDSALADDKHAFLLRLSRIEKIMTRKVSGSRPSLGIMLRGR
jgi:hypothetical protein